MVSEALSDPKWPISGEIIKPTTVHITTCDALLCESFQISKKNQFTCDWRAAGHPDPMELRKGCLRPYDSVSIYQYIYNVPRHLPHEKLKKTTNNKYVRETIFVDHSSSYVHIKNQVGLTSGKTIQSKKAFEQRSAQFSIHFKGFL